MRTTPSLALLVFLTACATEPLDVAQLEQATTVCGDGPTVKGIDVSYYQGAIDWGRVADAGVKFAFIRVSDGLNTPDTKFAANWEGSRANGVLRGAYQFFRPAQDPVAQADLLLTKMGALAADDLPPVIDVESDGGLAPAAVATAVKTWIDRVEGATGRTPIIYTGYYFWTDNVGGAAFGADYPLWHAQYTSATCPNIAAPWTRWAFWQYTDAGSIGGISGGVDTNRFNGTEDQLRALAQPAGTCGALPREGGTIDDGDPCFTGGGPGTSLRKVTTAGEGGDLVWTYTADTPAESNFAEWTLDLGEPGRYQVEVYTAAEFAHATKAAYVVRAAGREDTVVVDQSAVDGWQTLGTYEFAAGGDQSVHVGDNTGEPLTEKVQIAFDAVRLTRIEDPDDPGTRDPGDPGEEPEDTGCNAGGASGGTLLLGLALAGLRRRRR